MSIDRDLLLRAWPNGHLPVRGLQTVDHWQCRWSAAGGRFSEYILATGEVPRGETGIGPIRRILLEEGRAVRGDEGDLAGGALLPRVDPTDTATWACLLRDLADAAGIPGRHHNLLWVRVPKARIVLEFLRNYGGWQLAVGDYEGVTRIGPVFRYDIDDPSEALVRARIDLREAPGP